MGVATSTSEHFTNSKDHAGKESANGHSEAGRVSTHAMSV